MILDDDPWIADLLQQILGRISPDLQIDCFTRVQEAIDAWRLTPYQLVLTEWELPDAIGINLLKTIRRDDHCTPVLIITAHADRLSVMSVRPLGVTAFIAKPFQVSLLIERLARLIEQADAPASPPFFGGDFLAHLAERTAGELDLPLIGGVQKQLLSCLEGKEPNLHEVAEVLQHDPALCAKLIAVANSSAYNHSGRPCLSHLDALIKLGLPTCLNLAIGMALRRFTEQSTPLLRLIIQSQVDEIEDLCDRTTALSRQCNVNPAPLNTAALLHRMGELCVLHLAQVWKNSGHSLDENQVMQAITRFSGPFAISLKAHWKLPMPLRQLIGAVYALQPSQARREPVIMRLAAAELHGDDSSTIEHLRRLAGLA
jgi:HD-like signal output (HDOD) protein/CheY-like chemotaxis protein